MKSIVPRSLAGRLTVSMVGVLVVFAVVAASFAVHTGTQWFEATARHDLHEAAEAATQSMCREYAESVADITVLARLEALEDAATRVLDMRTEGLLQSVQQQYPGRYDEIAVLNPSLEVVASTDRHDIGRSAAVLGLDASGASAISLSNTVVNDADGHPRIAVVQPIVSSSGHGRRGWLVALLGWKVMEDQLGGTRINGRSQDEGTAFAILADQSGHVLAGRRAPEAILGAVTPRTLAQGFENVVRVQAESGQEYLAIAESVHLPGARGTETWCVLVAHRTSDAFAVMRWFERSVAVTTLLALLIAGLLSLVIARSITTPIRRLTESTQRFAHGELDVTVPEGSDPDLRDLARSFNAMTNEIAQSRGKLEKELRRSESALRVKNDFLSNVSHELRTPLTTLLGFTEILGEESAPLTLGQQHDFAATMNLQARRLDRIISDILDMSRLEAGEIVCDIAPMSPAAIVKAGLETHSAAAAQKGIALQGSGTENMPFVLADGDRVRQVLGNLLNNAIKFSPPGTTITIETRRATERWTVLGNAIGAVPVRGASAAWPAHSPAHESDEFIGQRSTAPETGAYVVFAVVDQGVGIAREDQAHIFDKFAQVGNLLTNKPQGTGLGLPIAGSIVVQHGGALWVESIPGNGSVFAFSIPAWQHQAGATRPGPASSPALAFAAPARRA
jgi:signal transduction histidine kinase